MAWALRKKPNFLAGIDLVGVDLATTLAAKAPLASPALTGTPTAPTAAAATSTTQLATTAFATTADNLKAPIASPTFTGVPVSPVYSASGITGATSGARFVGATAGGPPSTGTFLTGDFVVDRTGIMWVCTSGGSPGTWVNVGASGRVLAQASSDAVATGITATADITGLAIASFTVPTGLTATAGLTMPTLVAGSAGVTAVLTLTNTAGTVYADGTQYLCMPTNGGLFGAPPMRISFAAGTFSLKARIASLFGVASVGYGLTGDEARSWLKVTID